MCKFPEFVCNGSNVCVPGPDVSHFRLLLYTACSMSSRYKGFATIPECEQACLADRDCHGFEVDVGGSTLECYLVNDRCPLRAQNLFSYTHTFERRTTRKPTKKLVAAAWALLIAILCAYALGLIFFYNDVYN